MLRISHHRRFTANHTWHVGHAGHQLFVKANPNPTEAQAERSGHARISPYYRVPRLRTTHRFGRWTVLVYDRWHHLDINSGLLLDEITHADLTGDLRRLDACLAVVFGHYNQVIGQTLRQVTNGQTIGKLYGNRAAPGGRLDQYYQTNAPWPITVNGPGVRPSDLSTLRLIVNGRAHELNFADLMVWLRVHFASHNPVWAAVAQGDPTDINIGWSPVGGAVWFDYDTGGVNAVPGEFACFLLYQRLHGAWLTPHYNRAAFRDHPSALVPTTFAEPWVQIERDQSALVIRYWHAPSTARQYVLRRYVEEIIHPLARHLGIADLMDWLRPYLVMRLLAVYHLAELEPRDATLSLALLAEALDPATTLRDFLALAPVNSEVSSP